MTEATLFEKFAEYGLLGILLAIFGWAFWRKDTFLKESWQERIVDNKQLQQVIEATNHTYAANALATENRTRAQEAMTEAQQRTAAALEAQAKAIERLTAELERSNLQCETAARTLQGASESIQRSQKQFLEDVERLARTFRRDE